MKAPGGINEWASQLLFLQGSLEVSKAAYPTAAQRQQQRDYWYGTQLGLAAALRDAGISVPRDIEKTAKEMKDND